MKHMSITTFFVSLFVIGNVITPLQAQAESFRSYIDYAAALIEQKTGITISQNTRVTVDSEVQKRQQQLAKYEASLEAYRQKLQKAKLKASEATKAYSAINSTQKEIIEFKRWVHAEATALSTMVTEGNIFQAIKKGKEFLGELKQRWDKVTKSFTTTQNVIHTIGIK